MTLLILALLAITGFINPAIAQSSDCGLNCIANVSGSNCNRGVWSCLCRSSVYLENLSNCAKQACNAADYDTTINAIADICSIVNAPLSMSPYATAATMTNNPIFSTVALSNSLVPSVPTSRASTSSINNIAGTSISIVTTSGVPSTSSNAGARPSSTTPNVAQRHDLSRSAIQGVAVALLGLALYL